MTQVGGDNTAQEPAGGDPRGLVHLAGLALLLGQVAYPPQGSYPPSQKVKRGKAQSTWPSSLNRIATGQAIIIITMEAEFIRLFTIIQISSSHKDTH